MDMYVYIYIYIHTCVCICICIIYIYVHFWIYIYTYILYLSYHHARPKKTWTIDTCPMTMSHVDMCARAKTHKDPNPNRFFPGHEVWPLEWSVGRCHPRCYWNHSYIPKLWFRGAFAHSADLRPKLEKTDMEENRGLSTYSRTDLHIPTCHKSLYSNLELPTCSCCSI